MTETEEEYTDVSEETAFEEETPEEDAVMLQGPSHF